MPELPDIEHARRLAGREAVGRRIRAVRCARDGIVFEDASPTRVRRALTGRTVIAADRRGKHLWLELDERPWPLFHFGMTGSFHAGSDRSAGDTWPPRFAKIHLFFDDGGELVMTNARRLGRIRLRRDPLREPPVSDLGFDPLLDLPAPRAFARLLERRSAIIKALLLDQSFAAGVGNWIADEVLYQARIDPRRRADALTADEIRRLRRKLKHIVERAVAVDADKDRFPRTWLFHRRWGRAEGAVTARKEQIVHTTIGGRTTAWVPAVQV